jgi:hypothetical protein
MRDFKLSKKRAAIDLPIDYVVRLLKSESIKRKYVGLISVRPLGLSCHHLYYPRPPKDPDPKKPTSPNHRLPLAAFETHNGRSVLARERVLMPLSRL